jgi:hypothetical protein
LRIPQHCRPSHTGNVDRGQQHLPAKLLRLAGGLVGVVDPEDLRRRNTARSTGLRLSSRTRNAIDSESAVSACTEASEAGSVSSGSGSQVPT